MPSLNAVLLEMAKHLRGTLFSEQTAAKIVRRLAGHATPSNQEISTGLKGAVPSSSRRELISRRSRLEGVPCPSMIAVRLLG
jgi:hypothetical protein